MLALEISKNHQQRIDSGFYSQFCRGKGLDYGFSGMNLSAEVTPALPNAVGIDLNTQGYDGKNIPYPAHYFDYVLCSHVLEHIEDYQYALRELHRVTKVGGHIILMLPHAYLYDKSLVQFGAWDTCPEHFRLYTPARLLREIEESLAPNTYRIRFMEDNDRGYDYAQKLYDHVDYNNDIFEIVLVLEKIKPPKWSIIGYGERVEEIRVSWFVKRWRLFVYKLRRLKRKLL